MQDLTAERSGNAVELSFNVPTRTSDGLPLRSGPLTGIVCRQFAAGAGCQPVTPQPGSTPIQVPKPGMEQRVHWTDPLPQELTVGPARTIAYKVEILNAAGRAAGFSEPQYVAAGEAPPSVEGLNAEPVRFGVLLQWQPVTPAAGEVLLQRFESGAARAELPADKRKAALSKASAHAHLPQSHAEKQSGVAWLQAQPGHPEATETVDGTVAEGMPYSYRAVRRITVHVGGRTLELRSAPSSPVSVAWRDVFPPATPQQLTAVGFMAPGKTAQEAETYAVDLIWQPVNDPRVTGYLVSRVSLASDGTPQGAPERLTAEPITTPAFHDATALADRSYRYEVTATDAKGNVSAPAVATVAARSR